MATGLPSAFDEHRPADGVPDFGSRRRSVEPDAPRGQVGDEWVPPGQSTAPHMFGGRVDKADAFGCQFRVEGRVIIECPDAGDGLHRDGTFPRPSSGEELVEGEIVRRHPGRCGQHPQRVVEVEQVMAVPHGSPFRSCLGGPLYPAIAAPHGWNHGSSRTDARHSSRVRSANSSCHFPVCLVYARLNRPVAVCFSRAKLTWNVGETAFGPGQA